MRATLDTLLHQIAETTVFQLLCAVFIGGGTGSVLRWWLGMKLNPVHHAIPIGL